MYVSGLRIVTRPYLNKKKPTECITQVGNFATKSKVRVEFSLT